MRSLRSVVGALRKDHTCESVPVGKIVVGGTRASSVGDGVGAIEIGLALGLIDATEERDVLSRSGKVVERERVLFIGTEFSILYTSMHSPA